MTKISGVIHNSVVDGPGLRTAIFFSGCRRNCPGCHNPEAQNFDYGFETSENFIRDTIQEAIKAGDNGITLTGGHPLEPENYILATRLVEEAKKNGLSIWLYTGYVYEQIPFMYMDLIGQCDVVVDGPFIEKLKSLECLYRGSTNQRLIDIEKTMERGEIVLWKN
jgi:anaerobic ribonucleoside-triphosphate reductase activating protein